MISTKFIDVMESISDLCADDKLVKEIVSVYADKGYDDDAKYIRNYLINRNINNCIPFRKMDFIELESYTKRIVKTIYGLFT